MNTQWFLSHDGSVSGPMALSDAQKKTSDLTDVYVWQSNFKQWQAAIDVGEFSDFAKKTKPPELEDLSERFLKKKSELTLKLANYAKQVEAGTKEISILSQKIATYQSKTIEMDFSVKSAITPIVKQYQLLVDKIGTLNTVVHKAQDDIAIVSNALLNDGDELSSETIALLDKLSAEIELTDTVVAQKTEEVTPSLTLVQEQDSNIEVTKTETTAPEFEAGAAPEMTAAEAAAELEAAMNKTAQGSVARTNNVSKIASAGSSSIKKEHGHQQQETITSNSSAVEQSNSQVDGSKQSKKNSHNTTSVKSVDSSQSAESTASLKDEPELVLQSEAEQPKNSQEHKQHIKNMLNNWQNNVLSAAKSSTKQSVKGANKVLKSFFSATEEEANSLSLSEQLKQLKQLELQQQQVTNNAQPETKDIAVEAPAETEEPSTTAEQPKKKRRRIRR